MVRFSRRWLLCCLLPLQIRANELVCAEMANASCDTVMLIQETRSSRSGKPHRDTGKLRREECEGFKCQRGVKLQPPKRGKDGKDSKQALNETESEYQFQINEDGKWNTYYLPGATIYNKRTVNYGINDKYYLMASDTTDYSNAANFHKVILAGKTMIATINLNGAGCGCNVNFFLVNMPASSPGQYGDYYCDANCVGGNCCAEFDINEMNTHALQVTNHNCGEPPESWNCDGDGDPLIKFLPGEYGPGSSNTINTDNPFNFSLQALEVIKGSDSENYLQVFARLWQDGKTVMKSMGGQGSPLNSQWGNLAAGMVLVIDYWESGDLTWLDGASCTAPETCSGAHADLSDMKLITNALETPANCPDSTATGCSCDSVNYNEDDGTECWCVCACSKTSLVPRCTWSGYHPFWR
mmetsp:Transcript_83957/g.133046  ORF Transcript_83957/g.133046 Transcript_83957/m.133046 type:complete len:411 (-) Transcript_83957:306-1538(-)